MSALDELGEKTRTQKPKLTELEWFIWNERNEPLAEAAAAELASLRAKLEEAREIIEMLDLAANRDEIESVKTLAREWLK